MTDSSIHAAQTRHVRKSNELVQRARYKLDVMGQKVLLYLISKIEPDDKVFLKQDFIISDFCAICGINDSGKNYRDLKDALSSLLSDSAKVWVPIDDKHITPLTWIDPPVINTETGRVSVKLNDTMRPYLLDLRKNFTQYELIYTMSFRSKYSIRLYEIVKSYQYHDEIPVKKVFEVDVLRALLDAEHYPRYCNFKDRVLEPAFSEISTYTDKTLDVKEIKSGRKVISLEITIKAKEGKELDAVRQLLETPRRKRRERPMIGQQRIDL